ncbi:MAG: Fic family protein [Gammaproteobacteria bacterium]|nr:Fic family protein [Gammaproteobacteria bacterium]MDH5653842.1 Fic family protein [Gammaproteobacteria bacterium]
MEPYHPETLPIKDIDHTQLITLVGEANAGLARYAGLLQAMINPSIMLSPLTSQEAVLSSKIEGTQATIEEVLEHDAGQEYDETKTKDIKEIINYRRALLQAREEVADQPIRLSLIRQLHQILMDSVRGQDKTPGEFRKDQNWIGRPGCTMEQATFVPPNPMQLLDHLQAWETYLAGTDFDVIAQTAIVHAQFELLHPFKDGNGRIGRLLIPLFLYSKGRLSSPMFYLSAYLEENRDEYYDRLRAISQQRDWTGWIAFFLRAVVEQSKVNNERLDKIMKLYEKMKEQVREATHSQHCAQAVDALFAQPIFRVSDFCERSDIPKPTAHKILATLEEEKVIITLRQSAGRRPARYAFPELLNICEGKKVI